MLLPLFAKINIKKTKEEKKKVAKYYEILNIFCAGLFLNLLALLTINIGCKELNPAYTSGTNTDVTTSTTATAETSVVNPTTSTSVSSTTSATSSSTSTSIASSTISSTTSTVSTSETSSSISTSTTANNLDLPSDSTTSTGENNLCGNCEINNLEDCDKCNFPLRTAMCTDVCNIWYDISIVEDISMYCENFNYCGEAECGQCEADAFCYILHYKANLKNDPDFDQKYIIKGGGWLIGEINPQTPVTFTFEEIPNSYEVPDHGANKIGYAGQIWISETPFYNSGKAITGISCSLVEI